MLVSSSSDLVQVPIIDVMRPRWSKSLSERLWGKLGFMGIVVVQEGEERLPTSG